MGKITVTEPRKTPTQLKQEIANLKDTLENGARCRMCKQIKDINKHFYQDADPMMGGLTFTSLCRDCVRSIALRRDKNGNDHEPTKDSVKLALFYINKPFLDSVWDSSIKEAEDMNSGKIKSNVWAAYIKNIQMPAQMGKTYKDSDFVHNKVLYEDELTEEIVMETHIGQDTYDSFLKNKADVIRLLDYDPFERESISDQPFLYAQLLGLLDSSEGANEDMMRTSSAITIVRAFLQQSKIDDSVARLMSDISQLEKNSTTIRSLQDSKKQLTSVIKDLAAESCISLAHSKHSLKGENTWTGKIKKIKDLNLRDGQVNGFDINTCRGMQQVLDLSNAAIMKQLSLDESEWSDMVAELRTKRVELEKKLSVYAEINRILLQENLDLKDYLEEKGIPIDINLKDLKDLYSPFADTQEEEIMVDNNESDSSSE